jgi:hypothetical protein
MFKASTLSVSHIAECGHTILYKVSSDFCEMKELLPYVTISFADDDSDNGANVRSASPSGCVQPSER